MNVKELIQVLSQYDPAYKVVVDGYETGFDDIGDAETINIIYDPGMWYEGAYRCERNDGSENTIIPAILLSRGER